jgi:hypothetical protein
VAGIDISARYSVFRKINHDPGRILSNSLSRPRNCRLSTLSHRLHVHGLRSPHGLLELLYPAFHVRSPLILLCLLSELLAQRRRAS